MNIFVSTDLPDSPENVWAYLRDITSHTEWMHDALSIDITSTNKEGIGTTFDCLTGVGPLRTLDKMEITGWAPSRMMGVRHEGLVTGEGVFTLSPIENGTRFAWVEELKLPAIFGGPIGEIFANPILGMIWRRNLSGLRAQVAKRRQD